VCRTWKSVKLFSQPPKFPSQLLEFAETLGRLRFGIRRWFRLIIEDHKWPAINLCVKFYVDSVTAFWSLDNACSSTFTRDFLIHGGIYYCQSNSDAVTESTWNLTQRLTAGHLYSMTPNQRRIPNPRQPGVLANSSRYDGNLDGCEKNFGYL
jgi:hypothetical protein